MLTWPFLFFLELFLIFYLSSFICTYHFPQMSQYICQAYSNNFSKAQAHWIMYQYFFPSSSPIHHAQGYSSPGALSHTSLVCSTLVSLFFRPLEQRLPKDHPCHSSVLIHWYLLLPLSWSWIIVLLTWCESLS